MSKSKVKSNAQLDREHDEQVEERADFLKIQDQLQKEWNRKSGTGLVEASRGISRKQDSRFDDKKIKR